MSVAPPQAPAIETWEVVGTSDRVGSLGEGDVAEDGFWVDAVDVVVAEGTTLRVWVDSGEFDTTLRVDTPDGDVLYNDDYWDGTNSMVQFQAVSDGAYRVAVSSYAAGESGEYALHVALFDPDKIGPIFSLGDTVTGGVRAGGGGPGHTGIAAGSWFHAQGGERIRLRVTSPDFDTTATLLGPTGQSWYNDDANDTGPDGNESTLDSTVTAIAPRDGWYQLVVAPYGGARLGDYRVVSSTRPPITVAADAEIPDVGYAGTESEGRMFGVYVGITDYSPGDQLYGCADDATFLAEAFRHRRLQAAEDQIVLTDKDATRGAFEAAVRHVAQEAGPDDVVVLFYSGHGGVLPAAEGDPIELDGTDETLVFKDGQMRDDEFADLIDELDVDTLIVAIDACQSGGFARDIMTEPGRIGLFSSDEDVLSATAEPVSAGGYLSFLMRQAVLGFADSRPNDGAMLAGELGDFIIEGGVEHHRNMNPDGSNEPLQRMLIERGSYGWADPLWVFPRAEDGSPLDSDLCLDSEPTGDVPTGGGSCRSR